MKTPIILKIFAVLNLIIALIGLVIGAAFTIDFSDNYTIWNREIILSLYIILCSGWLFVGSLSWLFGFRSAFSLLIISVLSVFSFLIGIMNHALEVGVNHKDEKVALSIICIGFTFYGIILLSSIFSKQVKEWKAAKPEMKKLVMPLLIVFALMVYGSHLAIALGLPNEIQNRNDQDYAEAEEAMEYEYGEEEMAADGSYEEDYEEGYYDEEEYYDEESEGDYAYYNEPYEDSAPANINKSYPAPTSGTSINKQGINNILIAFFDSFSANEWILGEAFRQEASLLVGTGAREISVGNYYLGMASIYEQINPYFTKSMTIENRNDCYLYCYAEQLSGINPLLVRSDNDRSFNQYNPEIIKWMYTNLVPPTDASYLNNIMAKQLYGKVFRRFFRLYTQAYLHLQRKDLESEKQAYINAAAQDADFYGPSYLYDRYNGAISTEYDGSLDPTSAIGFWLRRGIDNTDDECWLGIQKLMNRYDAKWFGKIQDAYFMG